MTPKQQQLLTSQLQDRGLVKGSWILSPDYPETPLEIAFAPAIKEDRITVGCYDKKGSYWGMIALMRGGVWAKTANKNNQI